MLRAGLRICVAILIAVVIWWVGPLFALGIYRPFASVWVREVLVAAVLVWGLWPMLARLWMRLAMSARQVRMPQPVAQPHDFIDERLRDLSRLLKARWRREPRGRWRDWRGVRRREYLRVLPWYLVLGAQGSGKTSLVAKAAQAAAQSATQAAVRASDTEGTGPDPVAQFASRGEDFNFRLSDDAVWFDVGGRWNLRDDMDEPTLDAWRQLLRKLRRMRGDGAISGVVICIDSAAMTGPSQQAGKRVADGVRRRLAEMREVFGQQMQIYVALNGIDRLEGAVSMLSMMDASRWSGGVGFCLPDDPADENASAAGARWQAALRGVLDRVQRQVLFSAPAATDVTVNHAQLRFVEALSQLHKALLVWLHIAIAPTAPIAPIAPGELHAAARLRGVWMGSMAELALAQPAGSPTGAPAPTRPLSALWAPLFQQVLLERDSARSGGAGSWRNRIARRLRWLALPVLALALLLWFGWGYVEERHYLDDVHAQFSEAKRVAQAQVSDGPDGGSPLLDIADQMRYAQAQAEGAGRGMGGVTPYFEHRRVASAALDTYRRQLQKMLMPELYNEVRRTLVAQAGGAPGDVYQTLKVYLMLCRPERRHAADVERWLDSRWDSLTGGQHYGDDDRRMLLAHVHALISLPNLPATPEDENLVRSARAHAAQIPLITRVLQAIHAQGLPPHVHDISLARAAGPESAMSLRLRSGVPSTDVAVSGWYTRAGYTDAFLPRVEKSARTMLEEESWVLRDESLAGNAFQIDGLVQKLADSTRSQFLQNYMASWQNFLNDVTVRSVTGLDDAAQLAATMMDPQSPLANLLRFTARETTLTASNDGDIGSWIDRQKYRFEKGRRQIVGELSGRRERTLLLPEHRVDEHFQSIRQLAAQLDNRNTASSNPLIRLFEPLYRQLGLVNGALQAGQVLPPQYDAFSRLKETAARQPEPVRGIMLDLVNSGSTMTTRESGALLDRGAAGATSTVCSTGFTSRYPFNRKAQADAGVEDFERMFGAQGMMATYFRDRLAAHVDTSGTSWKALRSSGGAEGMVSPGVLKSYETAGRIRDAMLDESGHLRLSVMLRFLDMDSQVSEAQLAVGEQTLRYAHGTTSPQRIDWNGRHVRQAIVLQMKSVDGRLSTLQFDGPWALFRFFDAGQPAGGAGDRRERLYPTSVGTVRVEWQALTASAPIWSGILQSFRCPS
ncbi:type VI secretion system membrane subunit TssM [Burkholderia guangdongensis]|uniref:type VI secretion system membrane subunit TssM n=1 Tax=Burkholderia guangdongensis TaxID=1792500 RepID=UPI0015CD96B4|nr:type VI secretion system membrane subunit TssM [Burkholderia guangdongensis]